MIGHSSDIKNYHHHKELEAEVAARMKVLKLKELSYKFQDQASKQLVS